MILSGNSASADADARNQQSERCPCLTPAGKTPYEPQSNGELSSDVGLDHLFTSL